MNYRFKKFLVSLLTVIMLLSMLPTSVFADDATKPIPAAEITGEFNDEPTAESSDEFNDEPTAEPSDELDDEPTVEPSDELDDEPIAEPSDELDDEPIVEPSDELDVEPTAEPSDELDVEPTAEPSDELDVEPTAEPSDELDVEPTAEPNDESTDEPADEFNDESTIVSDIGCAHPNAFIDRGVSEENQVCEAINEYQHRITGQALDRVFCEDCGWQSEIPVSEIISIEDNHVFSSLDDFSCIVCSYVCLHPIITAGKDEASESYTYESLDNGYHMVTYTINEYESCDVCSWRTDTPTSEVGNRKECHYLEDGECMDCGYSGECAHVDVFRDYYTLDETYEAIDDKEHRITAKMYEKVYCHQCDTDLPVKLIFENGIVVENHTYEDGVCSGCEYVNACLHTNKQTEQHITHTSPFENRRYQPLNDRVHQEIGSLYERAWCTDCNVVFYDVLISEVGTVEEEHLYDWLNGVDGDYACIRCRYMNTCTHANTEIYEDWYWKGDPICVQLDDKYHEVIGLRYEFLKCSDCGITLDYYSLGHQTIKREHNFDLNGLCSCCGYIHPHEESEMPPTPAPEEPEAEPTPVPAEKENDDMPKTGYDDLSYGKLLAIMAFAVVVLFALPRKRRT